MICEQCGGSGEVYSYGPIGICDFCDGSGIVESNKALYIQRAKILKKFREDRELSIRAAAILTGLDHANWSKAERGLINPAGLIYTVRVFESEL